MSVTKTLEHLKKADPVLYEVALKIKNIEEITPSKNYFESLCESIVSQQLSIKAADTIWNRAKAKIGAITPKNVLRVPDQELRDCGLSWAKIKYIKDLASRDLDFSKIDQMADEEVIKHLTQVKGIGPWTAEMFLIFTLGRPDVFSAGDLGLKNAIKKIYKTSPDVSVWSPYRSYASRILWKSLEL